MSLLLCSCECSGHCLQAALLPWPLIERCEASLSRFHISIETTKPRTHMSRARLMTTYIQSEDPAPWPRQHNTSPTLNEWTRPWRLRNEPPCSTTHLYTSRPRNFSLHMCSLCGNKSAYEYVLRRTIFFCQKQRSRISLT